MAKQSRIHQLNEQLDLLISDPNAFAVSTDPEFGPILKIASDLRHMPSDSFKAQLKMRLAHQAKRMSEAFTPEQSQPYKGKSMTPETIAVTPYLVVKNAAQAIEFYKKALGANELFRLQEPDGRIGHAELKIGDAPIMLADEYPEYGILGPQTTGQSPVSIHLYVEDADTVAKRAVDAGARMLMPVQDQFYGDRSGKIQDPFGHVWHISAHIEDVTPEEMQKRFDEILKRPEAESLEHRTEMPEKKVSPIPEGYQTVTPYLSVRKAEQLLDFVKDAFGATETFRTTGSAGGLHAEVRIGSSMVMIGGMESLEHESPATIYMYVEDVDSLYERAVKAGGTSMQPPQDQPYGDRVASVKDAFGNTWYIASHIADMPE